MLVLFVSYSMEIIQVGVRVSVNNHPAANLFSSSSSLRRRTAYASQPSIWCVGVRFAGGSLVALGQALARSTRARR